VACDEVFLVEAMRRRRDSKAFTLIEAMLAMAILAAAAAGILLPYASGAAVQVEAAQRTLAAHLASDLLEEIAATPFANIVSTWHGYTEAEGQIRGASGLPLEGPAYAGLRRQVTCQTLTMGSQVMIWATVDVYHRGNQMVHIGSMLGDQ